MKIKVMIVDDSLFMRAMLRYIIESDENNRFEVVANATDGSDALRKLRENEIDVITLDVEMPKMNGLETLREIMKEKPKPVVMLSSLTKPSADVTIEALAAGAVDFITKPDEATSIKDLKTEILDKLHLASKVRLALTHGVQENKKTPAKTKTLKKPAASKSVRKILGIGTSTGGPHALRKIMNQIPADFSGSVLVAQHMPEGNFTNSLAKHLNQISEITIKEAEDGEVLQNGYAYIAPGGRHLEVYNDNDSQNQNTPGNMLHKPSVDLLFKSMSLLNNTETVGVVLTGMGSDGSVGAKYLKNAGGAILTESEETCVVFGMPRKVIQHNLSDVTLPLYKIIPEALKYFS